MRFWKIIKKLFIIGIILAVIVSGIYVLFGRSWIQRMGATDQEVAASMPGDGLVDSPGSQYTQATTINAPKDIVWSYLIQVGYRRAGWYNWDFINGMAAKDYFYENQKSADRIIPELQNLKEGDMINLVPQLGMVVSDLKEKEYFLLTGNQDGKYINTWAYTLKSIDNDNTRLCVRWTSELDGGFVEKAFNYILIEPGGAGIQQSQMLQGIKKRSERDFAKTKTEK